LKQREASLRLKELAIDERERAVAKKEKQVALLDRLTKEKMTRADVYLRQCRETRSVASSFKNLQQQQCNTFDADLDTSLSADPGDTSILPTSTKLNPEYITKPSPFVRVGSERRVHFDTLPVTKSKAKQHSELRLSTKQTMPQYIHHSGDLPRPLRMSNKVLYDIQEHIPSKVSKVHDGKEELQEKGIKNYFHVLERAEEDNFRNDVLAVLDTNKCASRSSNVNMVRPPSCSTSWMEDQTVWLQNKRYAYHFLGTMRAHRSANKENAAVTSAESQEQKVTKPVDKCTLVVPSAPKSIVGSLSSVR